MHPFGIVGRLFGSNQHDIRHGRSTVNPDSVNFNGAFHSNNSGVEKEFISMSSMRNPEVDLVHQKLLEYQEQCKKLLELNSFENLVRANKELTEKLQYYKDRFDPIMPVLSRLEEAQTSISSQKSILEQEWKDFLLFQTSVTSSLVVGGVSAVDVRDQTASKLLDKINSFKELYNTMIATFSNEMIAANLSAWQNRSETLQNLVRLSTQAKEKMKEDPQYRFSDSEVQISEECYLMELIDFPPLLRKVRTVDIPSIWTRENDICYRRKDGTPVVILSYSPLNSNLLAEYVEFCNSNSSTLSVGKVKLLFKYNGRLCAEVSFGAIVENLRQTIQHKDTTNEMKKTIVKQVLDCMLPLSKSPNFQYLISVDELGFMPSKNQVVLLKLTKNSAAISLETQIGMLLYSVFHKSNQQYTGSINLLDFSLQSEKLFVLLRKILQVNKMTLDEIIADEFFTEPLEIPVASSTVTYNTTTFQQYISSLHQMRSMDRCIHFSDMVVDDNFSFLKHCIGIISALDETALLLQWKVSFDKEEGIDLGALFTRFVQVFFEELVKSKLVEKGESGTQFHIATTDQCQKICSKLGVTVKNTCKTIGVMICKTIYEKRAIDISLSNALLRYLLLQDEKKFAVDWNDVLYYDTELAYNLQTLQVNDNVQDFDLDFATVTLSGANRLVNDQNKLEYSSKKITKIMFQSRRDPLKYVRKGFWQMKHLTPYYKNLSVSYLQILLTGHQELEAKHLIPQLQFIVDKSVTEEMFKQHIKKYIAVIKDVIAEMNSDQLRAFLQFCTGYSKMVSDSKLYMNPNKNSPLPRNKINIFILPHLSKENLPIAHVCFYRMDLPLYPSKEILQTKLLQAIELSDSGFHIK